MSDRRRRFETLVAALLPQLYRYAYWLAHDRSLAEDVVQEALLRAWRSLDTLQDERKARAWLLTIIRREHARHYQGLQPVFVDVDSLALADSAYPAQAEADAADLRRLLAQLEPAYREPLVLQVVVGLSCAEIAELLDLKPATVLTRLFRARRRLERIVAAPADAAAAGGRP